MSMLVGVNSFLRPIDCGGKRKMLLLSAREAISDVYRIEDTATLSYSRACWITSAQRIEMVWMRELRWPGAHCLEPL
jgi:hypothetical protein